MRTKILLLVGMLIVGTLGASHAGGAAGVRWGGGAAGVRRGGGGGGAVGVRWNGGGGRYWGGGRAYCAPRYYAPRAYGWGWGWRRPVVGIRVVTPAPVLTTAFVAGGSRSVASGSVVASAQEELAALGYYDGAIDGAFGPMTSTALQRYQQDNGLAVTGRLDRNTRASLGL